MLEVAILFALISTLLVPFGAAYADPANLTRDLAMIFALAWLVSGAVAVIMYRPLDRRVLHHA